MEEINLAQRSMQRREEDDYHHQMTDTGLMTQFERFPRGNEANKEFAETITLSSGANHLHLSPGKEFWVVGQREDKETLNVLVEFNPRFSRRFLIFCRFCENLHLKMHKDATGEVCVSIFCVEDLDHELIIDQKDQFYVVAIPKHTYFFRTNAVEWTQSRYNFEVHSDRHLELDIDEAHIYFVSVPFVARKIEPKCAFLFINSEASNLKSKEQLGDPLNTLRNSLNTLKLSRKSA